MSPTQRVIAANRTFRKIRIVRKSSTNEWQVKRIGSRDDGYFTDDVDDAISTATRIENEPNPAVQKYLKAQVTRPVRIRKSAHTDRQSASITALPTVGQQVWQVTLRRGSKPVLRITAHGVDQYQRVMVAVDLWSRGASLATVEKAVGKHSNG